MGLTDVEYSRGLPGLSPAAAWQTLTDLNQIGLRWMGTRGEFLGREYIQKRMMEVGLRDVRQEQFEYLNYIPISSELIITSPVKGILACEPLEYTANATAEGELVYVGTGSLEEFETLERIGVNFKGKIVASLTATPFWVCPLAEERGAAGIVIITDPPEDLIRRVTARIVAKDHLHPQTFSNYPATIPGVITNASGGMKLLSLSSAGKTVVRIGQKAEYVSRKSANIVGIVPGSEAKEQKVLIGAHLDTQLAGGVWDNGTGLAGMIEIARAVSELHPKRTIVFVAFPGEEVGEWGSYNYVKANMEDIEKGNYIYMGNLDAVSSSLTSVNTIWSSPKIRDFALLVAKQLGWKVGAEVDLTSPLREFSDQSAFHEAGVPSTWIWEFPCIHPYYHTEKDLIEFIDPDKWMRTLSVTALMAFKLAYMPIVPF
jgi:Iap family predicted aminopeptidase